MFKIQVEPRAAGEWCHCKVLNILWHHFYGLEECRPWKIVVDFAFYNNFFFTKNHTTKQPALRDMLRHFHGLYSHRPKLSTNQRARIRSVIVKFAIVHRLDNKVRESFVFENRFFKLYPRSSRQNAVLSSIY